jgi:PAS domain S-box-containing protein
VEAASIVVLGGSEQERAQLVAQLGVSGVSARSEHQLSIAEGLPGLIVITGSEVAHLVAEARDVPALADIPILAVVPAIPPTAVAEALSAGATDVARLPVPPAILAARCRNLAKLSRRDMAGQIALGRINEVLTEDGDDAEALIKVLDITVALLGFDRASLVAHIEGSDHAFVIAANDAEPSSRFTLAIAEYPEIAEAIRTMAPVLIDDVLFHPLTVNIAEMLTSRRVRGIAVFPVQWRGRVLGVMTLRRRNPGVQHIVPRGVELGRLIASITAAHLRHGAVLESLRDQTHRISRARYEAERRLRGIDSLKEHFEAGADGVVVLDDAGRILFVNRAAERITGFARDGLVGGELGDLVAGDHRTQIADTVSRVLAGVNVDAFDLQLSTTSGAPVWVSVSTSTVLAGTGAVILAFRDVTAERALEHELRSTKEFLERLIDSTVDAIIAADLRGSILLFNQGAERLFGYRARDVVHKHKVWNLYEEGGAKQIMRMLRSTSYGGVGRLEQTRREVRIASGEIVPVSMTASTVYEGDREVATVGILTDLRDRIRMEQRLLDAQQKLQLSEKQALVAELAGAAAHELNQPLTSIMGYAQLIQRQSEKQAAHLRAVGVILSEAERMAGIVKKIGKITKYETTDYVGSARMLDLDRASASGEGDAAIPQPADDSQTGEFHASSPSNEVKSELDEDARLAELVGDDEGNEATVVREAPSSPVDADSQRYTPRSSEVDALQARIERGDKP